MPLPFTRSINPVYGNDGIGGGAPVITGSGDSHDAR